MSFGLVVSCGTEVPHVTKPDNNDTRATKQHITDLQQDNTSTSAMRVKRSVDCLPPPPQVSLAGQSCGVLALHRRWLGCCDRAGQVHFAVLAHTSDDGEWSVLWHVPV
jgi:hypothetical protein